MASAAGASRFSEKQFRSVCSELQQPAVGGADWELLVESMGISIYRHIQVAVGLVEDSGVAVPAAPAEEGVWGCSQMSRPWVLLESEGGSVGGTFSKFCPHRSPGMGRSSEFSQKSEAHKEEIFFRR